MKSNYGLTWNVKTFVSNVAAACASELSASGIMQEGFRYAYGQAKQHGNLTLLSVWFNAVKDRNWRTGMALAYIRESIGNIKLGKVRGSDVVGFTKDVQDQPLVFNGVPNHAWYEKPAQGKAGATFVWERRLEMLIKGAAKAGMTETQIRAALHEAADDDQIGEITVKFAEKAA